MPRKPLVLAASTALLILAVAVLGTASANDSVVAATAVAATKLAQPLAPLAGIASATVNPTCVGQSAATATTAPVNTACVAVRLPPAPNGSVATGLRQGIPAIQPGAAQASAQSPALTTADVERYILALPEGVIAKGVERQGPLTVASVRCIPASDADSQLQIRTNVPPQTLVCVADVRGTFVAAGPPGGSPATIKTMYMIFDAKTGDLLLQVFRP